MFLRHGPAVSTSIIADQLGVSQAALFKRFGTKEELLRAALLPPAEGPFVALLAGGPDARPLPEQLTEILRSMSDYFQRFVPCAAVLRAAGVDLHAELIARSPVPTPVHHHRQLTAWLDRARAQGRIREVDTGALAAALLGAMNGRAFLEHLGQAPTGSAEAYVEAVVSALWRGVRPEESP